MRVAIVIGHKPTSAGAVSYNGMTEFEFNEELAGMIASNLSDYTDIETLIFHRKVYLELPGEINAKKPDLVVSLHANAFNKNVSGSEVLYYYKSKTGKKVAEAFVEAINDVLYLPNRGAKPKSTEERGGILLRYTDAPAVILEPFFIDNVNDFNTGTNMKYDLSLAIAEVIASFEGS